MIVAPALLLEHSNERWAWAYVTLILIMLMVYYSSGLSQSAAFASSVLKKG